MRLAVLQLTSRSVGCTERSRSLGCSWRYTWPLLSSSSSSIIVRPLSRITTMGRCAPLRVCDGAASGMRWRYPRWRRLQEESSTQVLFWQKNECLYWAVRSPGEDIGGFFSISWERDTISWERDTISWIEKIEKNHRCPLPGSVLTRSVFHYKLKTWLFGKSFPP